MSPTARNTVIASIAVALTVFMGWYAFSIMNTPLPSVQVETPSTGEPSTTEPNVQATSTETADEEVDTSSWQTYRVPELGFEISHPQDWRGRVIFLGEGTIDDRGLWKDRIGEAALESGEVYLTVTVRKSDLTLQDMNRQLRASYAPWDIGTDGVVSVNGLQALRRGNPLSFVDSIDPQLRYQMQDVLLIQDNDRFYSIDFGIHSESEEKAKNIAREWEYVLKSFKTFPVE